jgi:hypothetical protein
VLRLTVVQFIRPGEGHENSKKGTMDSPLSSPETSALYRRILEEVLINRAVLLRLVDRVHGKEITDRLLAAAIRDMQADMEGEGKP